MPSTAAGLNAASDGLASQARYISLHSGNPGTTGVAEISGGTPAYARKAPAWTTAVNGVRGLSAALLFDVPAGTLAWYGMWTAATGGTFLASGQLCDIDGNPATEVFAAQGVYNLSKVTLTVS